LDFFFRRALKALGARRRRLSWDLGTDCRIRWVRPSGHSRTNFTK
jgi:hypothetical protein